MSPVWGHLVGVVTVILMVIFIGIWVWAWRKKHKRVFSRMARIPMEDPLENEQHGEDEP